jgi:hypothetical protein
METRKKVIVHISNLSPEIMEIVHEKYPDGFQDHVFKITKPNNDFFYAFTLDTEETSYLIKVDVKIDTVTTDKIDEQLFSVVDNIGVDLKPEEEEDEEKKPKKSDDDDF